MQNEMTAIDRNFQNEEGMIYCVKDNHAVVLEQNTSCVALCGNRVGSECRIGCMELYARDASAQWGDWGTHVYRNAFLHDKHFDVTIISTRKHIVTILQSMYEKYQQAVNYYAGFDLSKREIQIMELVIKGMSNNEITDKLCISLSTLRTHLKHVYGKVKDMGGKIDFVPHERR